MTSSISELVSLHGVASFTNQPSSQCNLKPVLSRIRVSIFQFSPV